MNNIIDYVNQYGKYGFNKKSFNEVDSLIFSELSYLKFDSFFIGDAASDKSLHFNEMSHSPYFEDLFQGLPDTVNNRALILAAANAERFKDTIINYYSNILDEEKELQFSAVTFFPQNELPYIAIRGTDETLIGWKEDFNMAFMYPVPAQEAGIRYLEQVSQDIQGFFRIGGHSKGGNIAVYASMKAKQIIRDRIQEIYSHDGPGFKDELFNHPGYLEIQDRIRKTIPQSSVIGLLLQHQEIYKVVKSENFGILQHDPFSWVVHHGKFVQLEEVASNALLMNRTLNQWIAHMEDGDRKEFVNLIFGLFDANEIKTVNELSEEWKTVLTSMIRARKELDDETIKFLDQTLLLLMKMGAQTITKGKKGLKNADAVN